MSNEHRLLPFLIVGAVDDAVSFYVRAFGASENVSESDATMLTSRSTASASR